MEGLKVVRLRGWVGLVPAMILVVTGCLDRPEDRVAAARAGLHDVVRRQAAKAGLPYPVPRLFFRAFKKERVLEVWGSESSSGAHRLIASYPVAAMSGLLGPKRREGDRQVPEGVYTINRFNPRSQFHLSLGLDYPNEADRMLGDPDKPGSDIFIHGGNDSIGCLAMTDPVIERIYLMALDARKAGQRNIPVHIFPARLSGPVDRVLYDEIAEKPKLAEFWRELKPIYDAFERSKKVPVVLVDDLGQYRVVDPKKG